MARTIAAAAKPGPVQVMASHLHAQGVVPLLVSWFALLAIGTVMVGSASIALGGDYLTKHLLFLAVSGVGAALVFAIPTAFWDKLYLLGWLVPAILAVLVLIPFIGHEVNGASRWIRLGGFSLQAAEVAKFGLCLYLAGYLSRYHERIADDSNILFPGNGGGGMRSSNCRAGSRFGGGNCRRYSQSALSGRGEVALFCIDHCGRSGSACLVDFVGALAGTTHDCLS